MTTSNRVIIAAAVENIITLCVYALIVIFAPGAWKWTGVVCLLNLNSFKSKEGAQ